MKGKPEWILRATFESMLIIVSIVAALAVDEWRQGRQNQELATQSLAVFEREIRQNMARLDDAAPYHAGMRDVVARMAAEEAAAADLRSIMEGLEPTVLLSTAWETALATGALTYMDFEVVSALSLTYSLQRRFAEESRSHLPDISVGPGESPRTLDDRIAAARAYLEDLTRDEQQLRGVYAEALQMIRNRLTEQFPDDSAPGERSGRQTLEGGP